MKNLLYFSLKKYFNFTNKYYYFFDGLFKYQNKLKKEILNDIKIPPSTYRLNRINEIAKNNNHNILLKYFKVNFLLKEKQIHYEMLLSRLFMAIYYKNEDKEDIKQLEEAIGENNYLKPIFIMFRVLLKMNQNKLYSEIMEEILDDINYLYSFPREFFDEELEAIFLLILLYANKSKEAINDKVCYNKYSNLLWMYYHIMGTIAFVELDYAKAIVFYQRVEKIYLEDSNIKRYLVAKNNIAAMFNILNFPQLSLEVILPILNYVINDREKYSISKHIIMHYFMALFMLDDYKQIILFYKMYLEEQNLRVRVTNIIILIAYFKEGYTKEKLKEITNDIEPLTNIVYKKLYEKVEIPKEYNDIFKSSEYLYYISKKMKFFIEE